MVDPALAGIAYPHLGPDVLAFDIVDKGLPSRCRLVFGRQVFRPNATLGEPRNPTAPALKVTS